MRNSRVPPAGQASAPEPAGSPRGGGLRRWDLVGRRNLWFAISLLVILPGLYAWATRGLNQGIDFTGGGLITYELAQRIPAGQDIAVIRQARDSLKRAGVEARVQIARQAMGKDQLLVRTQIGEKEARPGQVLEEQKKTVLAEMSKLLPGLREVDAWTVTPVVSKQLLANALKAVAFGCLFILFWVWVRYAGVQWGFCALVALVHDVLLLLGVFALTQKEINSPFVAAALTVVGYSVHDTIVIFDRIRENLRLRKGSTFAETANISLLETMPRSINTVLTTEMVLVAAFFFGGASLRDFTFAMIVGVTTGAYSSIFNASQLMVVLKNREERKLATKRGQAARQAARQAAPTTRKAAPAAAPPAPAPRAKTAPASDPETADTAAQEEPAAAAGSSPPPGDRTSAARAARKKLRASGKRKRRF